MTSQNKKTHFGFKEIEENEKHRWCVEFFHQSLQNMML